ncbi:hypothetical protein, partial [Microbulbifer mangrovi]|uniref:hypothetical protein n=1 Tax=Microbulbifer mangrovi TaxID=927787 RepID=UPI00195B9419
MRIFYVINVIQLVFITTSTTRIFVQIVMFGSRKDAVILAVCTAQKGLESRCQATHSKRSVKHLTSGCNRREQRGWDGLRYAPAAPKPNV